MIEKMGGRDIFETILAKAIPLCHAETIVYQWCDPMKKIEDSEEGTGFLANTESFADFEKIYQKQLENQLAAMGNKKQVMESIFAHELEEILYKLRPLILKSNREIKEVFPQALLDDILLSLITSLQSTWS